MSRSQLAFSVLALVIVFSLVATALGSAVFDALTDPGTDDTIIINEDEPDAYEDQLRQDADENPNDAATLAALANYLAQTGRMSEAIDWYEKSLSIDSDTRDAWARRLNFARYLSDNDLRSDAELQFKKVVAADASRMDVDIYVQAHFYLAELYRNWVPARTEDAGTYYRRTIEVGPDTYVAELAGQALIDLGYATPLASPTAAPLEATP